MYTRIEVLRKIGDLNKPSKKTRKGPIVKRDYNNKIDLENVDQKNKSVKNETFFNELKSSTDLNNDLISLIAFYDDSRLNEIHSMELKIPLGGEKYYFYAAVLGEIFKVKDTLNETYKYEEKDLHKILYKTYGALYN